MDIEITEKQAEYIRNANKRWNFAIGAVRSGKSHIGNLYVIPACLMALKGKKGLNFILGVTRETIERNVLEPMRQIWGDDLVGNVSSRNTVKIFGEKVYCIGADKVGQSRKLQGSEIKFCYVDEIAEINKEAFEMLKSRLSLPYSVCHATANPSYPSHFIKKFMDTEGLDIYAQTYTLYDNPFLPKSFVESLEKEYAGGVYYQRYILGKWTKAEGLIYPMYEKIFADPVIDEKTVIQDKAVSIDYGTMNAFACLKWYKIKDVWYAVDGYYWSGRTTGKTKTDNAYYDDIYILLESDIEKLKQGEKLKVIIDPSAASFIALLNEKHWAKVRKADNAVLGGIRETASCIERGLIKVSPKIKEFRDEIEGYVWDEKAGDDRPIKEADHYMDGLRYLIKTLSIAKNKQRSEPKFYY